MKRIRRNNRATIRGSIEVIWPQQTTDYSDSLSPARRIVRALAWLVAALTALNALYFTLRATCPVIRSDTWYYLDVFLRKAINGDLGIADFFVKRAYADHAQPLFKLVLLANWRFFDLDNTPGAVLGFLAAAACAGIYYRLLITQQLRQRITAIPYIAWGTICALLFSLNGGPSGQWTWELIDLENITNLIILLFMMAVWHAHRSRRYTLLAVATLFLGISSDDSALVAVVATVLALLLAQFSDLEQRRQSTWKIILVISVCVILVRFGYSYAPVIGGATPPSITHNFRPLFDGFLAYGWWKWWVVFLTLPVAYEQQLQHLAPTTWFALQIVMALILLVAHLWFWRKAFRCKYDRTIFVAVSLMFVTYAWLAGILLYRTPAYGSDAVAQPRYTLLYAGQLIALLLMWAASFEPAQGLSRARSRLGLCAPVVGCFILIAVQIPLSFIAWQNQPYLLIYYTNMVNQINAVAQNPAQTIQCVPEVPVCDDQPEKRRELTQLLSQNRLNVFSPQMQRRHPYLPRLAPVSAAPSTSTADK